jgi:hypothetical protein
VGILVRVENALRYEAFEPPPKTPLLPPGVGNTARYWTRIETKPNWRAKNRSKSLILRMFSPLGEIPAMLMLGDSKNVRLV